MLQNIKLFFVIFISFINIAFSQVKVETLYPSPSPNVIIDISIVDKNIAWASATFGRVLRTTDAGKTWESLKSGGDNWQNIISAVDKNVAWFSSRDSLLFSTFDGGDTWNKGIVGGIKNIFSINFIDRKNGFVTGYTNPTSEEAEAVFQIWKTKNGGNSWELVNSKFDFYPTEIRFVDTKFGIVLGTDKMLRTVDGGKTWQKVETFNGLNINPDLSGILDDKNGWVLVELEDKVNFTINLVLFKTVDGGKKWGKSSLPPTSSEKSVYRSGNVHFVDKMNGWIIRFCDSETGYTSEVLRTKDGGTSWEISTINSDQGVSILKFFDNNNGIVAPQSETHIPAIFRTSDGGKSFEQITKGLDYNFNALHFLDEKTGFAGGNESIIKTTDGGISWEKCQETKGVEIFSIKFFNSKKGIALGNNEGNNVSIFATEDGGNSWVKTSCKSDFFPIKAVFPEENLSYAIVGDGSVARSENNYVTYSKVLQNADEKSDLYDIFFLNGKVGWVSGFKTLENPNSYQFKYFLKKTTDGGDTWTESALPEKISNIQNLFFVDSLYGWFYSDLGDTTKCVWNTIDGGTTWSPNRISDPNFLANYLSFQDRLNGWLVLSYPTPYMPWYIYRTKDGGKTWLPFTESYTIFNLCFVNKNTFYGGGYLNLIKVTGIE